MWMRIAILSLALVGMTVLGGCASKTLIESRPAGATVILDGDRYVGETPVEVRDLPWIASRRQYLFLHEGYYPQVVELRPILNSRHLLACMCTVGMLWPLMLFSEFPSDMVITMERDGPPPRAEFSPEPRVEFGL